jgi:peptidoglycan/xylan/chitin deacetylase (PgdA/CDA1 family)
MTPISMLNDVLTGAVEDTVRDPGYSEFLRCPDREGHALHSHLAGQVPWLDEQRADERPQIPDGYEFLVCLTHDTDRVSLSDPRHYWRRSISAVPDAIVRRSYTAARDIAGHAVDIGKTLSRIGQPDALHRYEKWLEIEDRYGARSTFLFCPERSGRRHYSDEGYRYQDSVRFDGVTCTVAEMMKAIEASGWEIGVHPAWHSWRSPELMKFQVQQVEEAIGQKVVSTRQHRLHFDYLRTPGVLQASGLLFDSTVGFNSDIGFRAGTSYPYYLHDHGTGLSTNVLEIPLAVQDVAMLPRRGDWKIEAALEKIRPLRDAVRESSGVLTLLWHTDLVHDEKLMDLYDALLAECRSSGAWIGSMREIGQMAGVGTGTSLLADRRAEPTR